MSLEGRYRGDDVLLNFYRRRLARPGWAGAKDGEERHYIAMARQEAGRRPRGKPFGQSVTPVSVAAQSAAVAILE